MYVNQRVEVRIDPQIVSSLISEVNIGKSIYNENGG